MMRLTALGFSLLVLVTLGACATPPTSSSPPSEPPRDAAQHPSGASQDAPPYDSVVSTEPAEPNSAKPETAASDEATQLAGTALVPTEHSTALGELGLDPRALPPLEELDPMTRYKVMDLISASTGLACEDCHAGENYKEETAKKNVARRMWNELTAPFSLYEGAVFCDSCHQGSPKNLARQSKEALKAHMKTEYVGRLVRRDGEPMECASCHGTPFDGDFIEGRWAEK